MKNLVILCILVSSTLGNPVLLYDIPGALPYVKLLAEAPIGPDGQVVDTPDVTEAKAQHEAAQVNQKIKLADEAVKSADPVVDTTADPVTILETSLTTTTIPIPGGAPLGADGQVVDTPEVTKAKADHAAAQRNERIKLAQENDKSNEQPVTLLIPGSTFFSAPLPIIPQIIYPAVV